MQLVAGVNLLATDQLWLRLVRRRSGRWGGWGGGRHLRTDLLACIRSNCTAWDPIST